MWEEDEAGRPKMSGIRMTTAGRERIVKADAYVAALDVPGVKKLLPQVPSRTCHLFPAGLRSRKTKVYWTSSCLASSCLANLEGT